MRPSRGFRETIAAFLFVVSSSAAFALEYVLPYPNNKRDATTFVVHERKNGSYQFVMTLDEQKLGSRVPSFEVSAYPKPLKGQTARGVEFTAALLRDSDGKLRATFVLDKELAWAAQVKLTAAPLPPETRDVPGGTFYAFKVSDFVEFGPTAVSDKELHRRIEDLNRTGRFQSGADPAPSVDLLKKVHPIREED